MKRCGSGASHLGKHTRYELRHRRRQCGDKWHLDEVVLTIGGKKHSLWRAVDQEGNVPDILVQNRRKKHAAKRFFRKLIYVPGVIITDKLVSYAAAKREILPGVKHRQHKPLTNRAENSHQPLCWLLRISVQNIDEFSCRSVEKRGRITPAFSLLLLR